MMLSLFFYKYATCDQFKESLLCVPEKTFQNIYRLFLFKFYKRSKVVNKF